ncbi:MAG: hypothetical protein Q8N61_00780 [bacterium]|nr:hypothetical protein [bacterium]
MIISKLEASLGKSRAAFLINIEMVFPSLKAGKKTERLESFAGILGLFSFWKILFSGFALLAISFLPLGRNYVAFPFYPRAHYLNWVWANFDGLHYLEIALRGYHGFDFAYFPLLSWLISLAQRIFLTAPLPTAVLICNLAFLASLFVIFKIILLDYSTKIAWRTIFFIVIFPTSFYYGAIYTESVYLLLATLSFYFARKSKWLFCGILGYFAGLTRLVGVALLPALLAEWLIQNKFSFSWPKFLKTKAYFLFLVPLGIITYAVFLQLRYGDALLFQKSMSVWEQSKFVFPLQVFWRYLKIIFLFPDKTNLVYWVAILEMVSAFFYFALGFYALKRIRISYGIFMLLSLIIPIFTGTLQSMPRYILHLFPAFLAIALLTEKSKSIFCLTIVIFLVLGFILTALFTRGYFIG